MNKKYIDFVPVKEKARPTVKKQETVSAGGTSKVRSVQRTTEVSELEINDMFGVKNEKVRAGVTVTKGEHVVSDGVKPRFVRTEVEKRPLSKSSKNVYQKKIVEPKEEEPSKPVTIIHKPEKDSKVGLIVTIIITIILGAAAGTVAFLLLPK